MSLPACFAPASDAAQAIPLIVLDRGKFTAWRDAQNERARVWLESHGFVGVAGSFLTVPAADGRPEFVVAGIADAEDPLALSHLPQLLPAGMYRLDARSPLSVDPADRKSVV